MSQLLVLTQISHRYGQTAALTECTLTLAHAERVALIGPSGCGKSTLLRIIAGLETGHQGRISYHGSDITQLPAHRRHIGLMFQEHALFPHLTVTQNIAYGIHHLPTAQQHARINELLTLIGLPHLAARYPATLSGGERQRVALARSLAPSPRLLLLDEPFASLDRSVRDHLLAEVPALLAREQVATIYVTHDANEACQIANRVIVMRAGQIVRDADPATLYQQPQSEFVAQLLGIRYSVPYTRNNDGSMHTAFGDIPMPTTNPAGRLIIPPDAGLHSDNTHTVALTGIVVSHYYRAPWVRVTVGAVAGGAQFEYDMPQAHVPDIGSQMTITVRLDRLSIVAHI